MSAKQYPSVEYLRQCFRYEDGKLFWLERPRDHFADKAHWKTWTRRFVGKQAGCLSEYTSYKKLQRYWVVSVNSVLFKRSNLVWTLHCGEWPKSTIDHENQDTLDDRIVNLRLATKSQNAANTAIRCDNTTGFKGVSFNRRGQNWEASIKVNQKRINLGYFNDPFKASMAYQEAAKKYFGEFACNGDSVK